SEEEKLLTELRGWDFHTSPDQWEPPLFSEWWRRFEELAWGKWKQEGRPIMMPNSYQTTLLLREDPENEIFDHPDSPERETARDWVRQSFIAMALHIQDWRGGKEQPTWAAYKKTSLQHLVPNFTAFGYFNISTGGGRGIINATS